MQTVHYKSIGMATVAIAGLPAAWNLVARNEYRRHTLERVMGGKLRGAYLLAAAIFAASSLRDYAFQAAITHNPSAMLPIVGRAIVEKYPSAASRALRAAGAALVSTGSALVVSSFLRLGITGTYLGDYFGITLDERVTAFPFSHFENPMYLGATMNFLGSALAQNSGVGLLLTGWIAAVYHISTTHFENPFTAMIYAERAEAANQMKEK